MSTPSRAATVLVVGAHPDDAELGAGGLLAAARERGSRTAVVVLSRGEGGASGTAEERLEEARRAAAILSVDDWYCLGLPDTSITDDPPSRERLEAVLIQLRPDLIVTHGVEDWHQDHRAASLLVDAAWSLANRGKRHGAAALPRPRILHFHVDPLRAPPPHLLVDISPFAERKKEALEAFASQREVLRRVMDWNALRGAAMGVSFAEAFCSPEPVMAGFGLSLV
jgi:LmbE family N-acetylglucosaminyl deacetylase